MLEPTQTHKDVISQLVSSEDVQLYWCSAAADFDTGDEKTHSELLTCVVDLFVTVHSFAFATAWIEKHKQSEKKSTQRSKGATHEDLQRQRTLGITYIFTTLNSYYNECI